MGPWRCLAKVAISLGLEKFLTGFGEPKGVRGVWSTILVLDLFGIGALGWVQPWKEWAYDSTLRHDSSLGLTTTLSPHSPSLAHFATCSMQFLLRRRIHRQWVARRALVCGSGKKHLHLEHFGTMLQHEFCSAVMQHECRSM